jgi:hypothetical protein
MDVSPEFLGELYKPGKIKGDLKLARFQMENTSFRQS